MAQVAMAHMVVLLPSVSVDSTRVWRELLTPASILPPSDPQPVVHVLSSREQDWPEQDVAIASSPTIIYQEVSAGDSQSATSTIKALLELQQTTGELSPPVK